MINKSKLILVTGGAGYIGTHTLIELKKANFDFVVYDNFSNSSKEALKRIKKITGAKVKFIKGDIRDKKALRKVFKKYTIDSVIHFAGLKAVGESVAKPLKYYDNNVVGTIKLLEVMREFDCKKIVFSEIKDYDNYVFLKNGKLLIKKLTTQEDNHYVYAKIEKKISINSLIS